MPVVLGIYDQHIPTLLQLHISLHHWEKLTIPLIERPWNLRCTDRERRKMPLVVGKNEFLIQVAHVLRVHPFSHVVCSLLIRLQQSFYDHLADCKQHAVILLISLIADRIPRN